MSVVDECAEEAEAAIRRMIEAATEARALHARAELLRHMRTTARSLAGRGREGAVEAVVGEWMAAWGVAGPSALGGENAARVADAMRAFTEAFHDVTRAEHGEAGADAAEADRRLRAALASLEAAFRAAGTTLSDEMAWRSECAHGWWALVRPPPSGLPRRASVPEPDPQAPFWAAGCAPHCR